MASRFDKLARDNGHKRAGYLRFIVEKVVIASEPESNSDAKPSKPTTKGSQ